MGTILELDDKLVASDTYSIIGFSDTNLNLIQFNVLNGESCSKHDQIIVTEPLANPDGITISQDMDKVC